MGKGRGGKIQGACAPENISSLLELEPRSLDSETIILYAAPCCTVQYTYLTCCLEIPTERHLHPPAGAVVIVICTECCSGDPRRVTFTVYSVAGYRSKHTTAVCSLVVKLNDVA